MKPEILLATSELKVVRVAYALSDSRWQQLWGYMDGIKHAPISFRGLGPAWLGKLPSHVKTRPALRELVGIAEDAAWDTELVLDPPNTMMPPVSVQMQQPNGAQPYKGPVVGCVYFYHSVWYRDWGGENVFGVKDQVVLDLAATPNSMLLFTLGPNAWHRIEPVRTTSRRAALVWWLDGS